MVKKIKKPEVNVKDLKITMLFSWILEIIAFGLLIYKIKTGLSINFTLIIILVVMLLSGFWIFRTNKKLSTVKKKEKTPQSPEARKREIQMRWIFGIALLAIIIFLIYILWFIPWMKTFSFAGLKWQKVDYGGLTIYHSQVATRAGIYDLNFRNNPKTNNVSIDNITIQFYNNVIITNDPLTANCAGINSMANLELSKFLGAIGLNISGALSDRQVAKDFNVSFADCNSAINKTVIFMKKSNSTSITKEGECYILSVGECENIKVEEKFIAETIRQIMEK